MLSLYKKKPGKQSCIFHIFYLLNKTFWEDYYAAHYDNRVTQSRWEDHEITGENITDLGVIFINMIVFDFFSYCKAHNYSIIFLLLISDFDFKIQFRFKKILRWLLKQCQYPFSSIFSKWPLYYHGQTYIKLEKE